MAKKALELYIHIPFCAQKCIYCDFLSFAGAYELYHNAYFQALREELQYYGTLYGKDSQWEISSVFIGGGTPSLAAPEEIVMLLQTVRDCFSPAENVEITMEANPGTVSEEKLRLYAETGINRLSFGVQSLSDDVLSFLGRIHRKTDFLRAYESARAAGFKNINLDLILGVPGDFPSRYGNGLREILSLRPEHISAYSLIVEEGTPFAARKLNLPDEDTEYNMYEATAQILKEYGLEQYEISNYARKGRECRHNVGYWTRQDYLGFGLGASSLYGKERFANTADMKKYLENSRNLEKIREKEPSLTREDEMAEFMFLGLRMIRGIVKSDFQENFGCTIESVYEEVLEKYESMGLLLEQDGRIFLSRDGIHVSNSIMAEFLL